MELLNWQQVPDKVGLAFSGGSDSMFALDMLLATGKEITLYHFYHGTGLFADQSLDFVSDTAKKYNIKLIVGTRKETDVKGKRSPEEFFRDIRYSFLNSYAQEIITAHNLDDCVESYVMGCLHGTPRIMPFRNKNIIRPFLLVKKVEINERLKDRNLIYMTDPTNTDFKYRRNIVRHKMMSDILAISPGIHTVVKKKVLKRTETDDEFFRKTS